MKPFPGNPALTLALLFGVSLLGEVDYQIIPPLLPLLATGFRISPGYAGRAVTVYSLSAAFAILLFGFLSDHVGRKPFIQLGLLGFSGVTFLSSWAGSIHIFLLTRFLAGITAGAFASCVTSYAADYFQYGQRGRAIGILSAAYFAAAIIGIPSAILLSSIWGWQKIYWINSGLALILGLLVIRLLPDCPSLLVSTTGTALHRLKDLPLAMKPYFIRKDMVALLAVSLLSSGSMVRFITYLGSHLHHDLHLTMKQVSGVFLWCGLASLAAAPLSGLLSDRFGKKNLLVFGGVMLAVCMVSIPALSWGRWLWIGLASTGAAMAFRMAPLLALLTEMASPSERGTLLAVRNTLSQLGIATISLASSYCYLYKGYQGVGWLTGILIAGSTSLVALLVKEPKPGE